MEVAPSPAPYYESGMKPSVPTHRIQANRPLLNLGPIRWQPCKKTSKTRVNIMSLHFHPGSHHDNQERLENLSKKIRVQECTTKKKKIPHSKYRARITYPHHIFSREYTESYQKLVIHKPVTLKASFMQVYNTEDSYIFPQRSPDSKCFEQNANNSTMNLPNSRAAQLSRIQKHTRSSAHSIITQ